MELNTSVYFQALAIMMSSKDRLTLFNLVAVVAASINIIH